MGTAAPAAPVRRPAITDLARPALDAYAAALRQAMPRFAHPAMNTAAAATWPTPWDRAILAAFEAVLRAVDPPRTGGLCVPTVDIGAPLPPAFADPASALYVGRSPEPLLWSTHAWIDRVWAEWDSQPQSRALPPGHAPALWLAADRAEIRVRPVPVRPRISA